MDGKRFDALTKALAGTSSRRNAIRTVAAATAGGIFGVLGRGPRAADTQTCSSDQDCAADRYCRFVGPSFSGRCTPLASDPDFRDQVEDWCSATFPARREAARCLGNALQGRGPYWVCGPRAPVLDRHRLTPCGGTGCCAEGATCDGGTCHCPDGERVCPGDDRCTDLRDIIHCGRCNRPCPFDAQCVETDGVVECQCPDGKTDCDNRCVDTMTDPANCGGCGRTCAQGEVCAAGRCAPCQDPLVNCPFVAEGNVVVDRCVDPRSDPEHCGGCDAPCRNDEICVDRGCVCPEGTSICGGECIDLNADERHCGECFRDCALGASCVGGSCQCPAEQVECVNQLQARVCAPDCPARGLEFSAECSGCRCPDGESPCGSVDGFPSCCPNGQACCDDICCGPGEGCASGGGCEQLCPTGLIPCNGICVDPLTDPNHCGGCAGAGGDVCTGGETCVGGACTDPCQPGEGLCGAECCPSDNVCCGDETCSTCCGEAFDGCNPARSCSCARCHNTVAAPIYHPVDRPDGCTCDSPFFRASTGHVRFDHPCADICCPPEAPVNRTTADSGGCVCGT